MATVLTEKSENIQVENTTLSNSKSNFKSKCAPPQVKKKPTSRFKKGLVVWIHDKQNVWVPASIVSCTRDEKITVTKIDGQDVVIRGRPGYPLLYAAADWIRTDNLVLLNPLSEPAVLNCLRERYLAGRYHTQTGRTLVSLNPFKETGLYDIHMIHEYHNNKQRQPPHVFGVAETAFCNLSRRIDNINQSIIVSGESGAGKTWNARCLLKYLTTVAVCNPGGFTPSPADCIERRILDSNPILEAFGNAGTARNNNSSRFGKYIKLQFSRGNHVVGASIQTYLLEKTRVVYQCQGARNFHIFYQMLFGASDQELRNWSLLNESDSNQFNYLQINQSDDVMRDKQDFATTRKAMNNIGLSRSQQQELFKLLASILHLGNIEFVSDDDDVGGPCDIDSEKQGVDTSVDLAAKLLGLDVDTFTKCLAFRQITATHRRRKSVFMKPCSKDECHTRRDCLAKLLYARVFDWLVEFINASTRAGGWESFIGLLDVYGFESFEFNSLEQLCINYANEKLQQHFVENFLKAEQDDYLSEGIPWNFYEFTDNRPCLDIIEGKISIFSLMNEHCKLNRPSDSSSFNEFLYDNMNSMYLSRPHVSLTSPAFVVHHYADKVIYQVDGIIDKNKDGVPAELVDLLKKSSKKFVQQLVSVDASSQQSPCRLKGKQGAVTVVSKFKTSLDSLMSTLHQTTPHYIRCIKPSLECKPDSFDNVHVINQLRACGVLETIQISSTGFPTRMLYNDFVKRYGLLLRNNPEEIDGFDTIHKCAVIINQVFGEEDKENENNWLFGKTKIFLRDGQLDELEIARLKSINQSACLIQRWWRRWRQETKRQEAAIIVIQAGFRGWKAREDLKRRHQAARVIQYAMIGYSIRLNQRRLEQQLNEVDSEEDASFSSNCSDQYSIDHGSDHTDITQDTVVNNNNLSLNDIQEQSYNDTIEHEDLNSIKKKGKTDIESMDEASVNQLISDINVEYGASYKDQPREDSKQGKTIVDRLVQVATTPVVDVAFGIVLLGLLYHGPLRI